jgi:hypothetical protein
MMAVLFSSVRFQKSSEETTRLLASGTAFESGNGSWMLNHVVARDILKEAENPDAKKKEENAAQVQVVGNPLLLPSLRIDGQALLVEADTQPLWIQLVLSVPR